jgi:hypothetical protein
LYYFEGQQHWVGIDFLTDGLRIDDNELETLESFDFYEMIKVYRAKWVNVFLCQLRQVLGI